MTSASMPETNSENPKSPPAPSSGAPPTSLSPVSQERSPSRRAMNPSTLMPRKTDPVKEAFMTVTVSKTDDDAKPRRHGTAGKRGAGRGRRPGRRTSAPADGPQRQGKGGQ